jgi:hypothetical protein
VEQKPLLEELCKKVMQNHSALLESIFNFVIFIGTKHSIFLLSFSKTLAFAGYFPNWQYLHAFEVSLCHDHAIAFLVL